MDLTRHTFIKALTLEATYNGITLEYGVILDRRQDMGRPGVAGEYRPQQREGAGNHATIFIRCIDSALACKPTLADKIEILEDIPEQKFTQYVVRGVKGPVAGAYELLCSETGSRLVDASKGSGNNVTGLRN